MQSLWKKLFIAVTILLVVSFVIGGGLWYQLDSTKTELVMTKAELDTTKTQLDTTKTQLDTTKTQLDTTKAELDTTKTRLETVENEQTQMLNHYSDLREQINIRLGKEQDRQSFVTPDDVEVSANVQEITDGYSEDVNELWRDYDRLYRWVVKNIDYSGDSYTPLLPDVMNGNLRWKQEFWRMPAETLKDKTGDCEDMAVLLASLLLSYNEGEFAVWVLGIQTREPEYKGHLAVAFPVKGNKLTILDPAGNYYTGYHSWRSLRSDDVAVATNEWLSHWAQDMPGAQIVTAFSGKFYREFSGTEEFIDWVLER